MINPYQKGKYVCIYETFGMFLTQYKLAPVVLQGTKLCKATADCIKFRFGIWPYVVIRGQVTRLPLARQ